MHTRTWSEWAAQRPARHWAGDAIITIALAMFGCSAYFNWAYTSSLATDPNARLAMGVAGVSIAAMLAALSVGKHFLDKREHGSMRFKVFLLVAVLAVAEVWNAMGAISTKRGDAVGARKIEQTAYVNAETELARVKSDLAAAKAGRSPGQIAADINTIEIRPWFAQTANCSAPGSYANSCRRYLALKGELAAAQSRNRLIDRERELTTTVAAASGSVRNEADPQSVVAGRVMTLFGVAWTPQDIGLLAPLGIALVLMLGGWIGVEAGFAVRGVKWMRAGDEDAQPTATIHVMPTPGPSGRTGQMGPLSNDRIEVLTKSLGEMARAQASKAA